MSFFRRAGAEILRVIERAADPAAELNRILVYGLDVAGVTELFARASDGTISKLTPAPATIVAFGNNSVAAAADTRFMDQWGNTVTAGTTESTPIVAPRSGTLRNMYARHASAVGNGNNIVYTVRINGANTLLAVTLATGAIGTAFNLVNTVAVVQGDLITVSASKAAALGNGGVIPTVAMGFV